MPTYQQFPLPDAGEGLTEAEIVEWRVAVGDAVTVNQTIVEIETAKSLVELPCPWAGVVTAILVEPGSTVDVGTPIIEIDVDPAGAHDDRFTPGGTARRLSHVGAGHDSGEPGGADEVASARDAARGDGASDDAGRRGDGAPGSAGRRGDGPADEREGREPVLVGYGRSDEASARRARRAPAPSAPTDMPPAATRTPPGPAASSSTPGPSAAASGSSSAAPSSRPHALAKPPVRKLARDLGVDLDTVTPTGPGGIVTREDVLALQARAGARELATYPEDPWMAGGVVSPGGRQTRVPVKSVRKRTAEAMVASAFTAPHVTVFHTVDVTATMKLVERLRADREFADVRVTPLLLAAKALLMAVRRHPEINASWDEEAQEIVYKHYVNLGIAAATPRGLVVPNVKDAHRLGLHDLAQALAELTATARAGRTSPADMADGTITITNVGVFGIDTGTPILNPGEAAILAFGSIRLQPWVHSKVKPRHVTQLALSFDHRLVDGALGSRVLADVAAVLGDPSQGMVWS